MVNNGIMPECQLTNGNTTTGQQHNVNNAATNGTNGNGNVNKQQQ